MPEEIIESKGKNKLSRFKHDLFKIYHVQNLYFLALLLVITSSITTFFLEKNIPEASIKSYIDSLWWSIATITSVRFIEKMPVSVGGRIIGAILAILGLVLIGVTISLFALYFSQSRSEYNQKKITQYLDDIEKELAEIKKKIEYLVKK